MASQLNTPAALYAPAPRTEPIPAERILSVSEVTTIFKSAEDFVSKKSKAPPPPPQPGSSISNTPRSKKLLRMWGLISCSCWAKQEPLRPRQPQVSGVQISRPTAPNSLLTSLLLPLRLSLIHPRRPHLRSCFLLHRYDRRTLNRQQVDQVLRCRLYGKGQSASCSVPVYRYPRQTSGSLTPTSHWAHKEDHQCPRRGCDEPLKDGLGCPGSTNRMRFDMAASAAYPQPPQILLLLCSPQPPSPTKLT